MRAFALLSLFAAATASAQPLAITGAEAWTMVGDQPVRDATIVIEDGRIRSVQSHGPVPSGARIIDAAGRKVTPGLVNAATQIGLVEISASPDTRDTLSRDERNGATFDMSRALNGNSALVELARADGLTRALVYPSPSRLGPVSGEAAMIRLRDGADILDRADIGVYAVIGGGVWDRLGSRAVQWTALRKAIADAKRNAAPEAAGKKKASTPMPARAGDTLHAVVTRRIPLAIQAHRESDIRQAATLAEDFGIDVIIVGGAEAWRAAELLARADVAVILDPLVNLPATFDQLGARQDNAVLLSRAGVRVAFGLVGGAIHSNYNAGLALREGAGIAVANGLPYDTALRAVTTIPLAMWRQEGGTLAAGSPADLVIWDGDPLEPSTNALHVIVEGREISTVSRQDRLAARYRDVGQ